MARRRQLGEALLGLGERLLGLVETALSEKGPPKDELRVSDLVEEVRAAVEELERVPCLALGELDVAAPKVHLRERGHGLRAVGGVANLERDPERVLQLLDRLLRFRAGS